MAELIIGIAFIVFGVLIISPAAEQLAGTLMLVVGVAIIVGKLKESE